MMTPEQSDAWTNMLVQEYAANRELGLTEYTARALARERADSFVRRNHPQPTPTVPAADAVKALYEALEALTGMAGGVGSQDVDRLVQAIKRSLINPQGVTAASLLAAIVRYENVRNAQVPRYDETARP